MFLQGSSRPSTTPAAGRFVSAAQAAPVIACLQQDKLPVARATARRSGVNSQKQAKPRMPRIARPQRAKPKSTVGAVRA